MTAKRASSEEVRQRLLRATTAAIARHRQALDRARARLGELTKPGDPDVFLAPEWAWAEELHSRYAARLRKAAGVVGVGLGVRRKRGAVTPENCIVVYVKKKRSREWLRARRLRPIPSSLTVEGRKVPIDVVECSALELQTSMGGNIGPTHRLASRGTLGAFVRDTRTQETVAITAMHVAGVQAISAGQSIPFLDYESGVPLGVAVEGTQQGVDAVKIVLEVGLPRLLLPGFEPLRGWRPVHFPADARTSVWLHGAVSGSQGGILLDARTSLLGVEDALVVDIFTQKGDSGAALIDKDKYLLGFLVGRNKSDDTRVFCPAGKVFKILGCDIP